MAYTPSQKILERYADVLVNFGLGKGKGIKKGDVVLVWAKECTKPLFIEVCKAIWSAGGHVIDHYTTNEWERRGASAHFYHIAQDHHLDFFPDKYYRGLVDQIDHQLAILGEADPHFLKEADPHKVMRYGKTMRQFMEWRTEKEHAGKFTWTLALYGTPAMAKEAKLSEQAYWEQIIKACFLDKADPIREWRRITKEVQRIAHKLDEINKRAERFHMVGPEVDLWIRMGEKRRWRVGDGVNIPSFEIFTSPDWRGVDGWIRFNQPLYRYGNLITGIELVFKDGCVVRSSAKKNEKVLKAMIATEGADRIGEWSLTDGRHSRITKFMAETLYDENMGGPHGNTHLALGNAYEDTYDGDVSKLSKKESARLGFNRSSVHTDIISTAPRTVTAHLMDGTERVIYKNGKFAV